MQTEELLKQALRLSRDDRARVAHELLSSLEESEDDAALAWVSELERRSREVTSGHVSVTPWETARSEILAQLAERRARRSPSEARVELRQAALWYDERSPGMGESFVTEVSAVPQRVGEAPRSFSPWPQALSASGEPIRRAVTRRFPYVIAFEVIAFEVHPTQVLVLAIAHGRRRPLYWIGRSTERPE